MPTNRLSQYIQLLYPVCGKLRLELFDDRDDFRVRIIELCEQRPGDDDCEQRA